MKKDTNKTLKCKLQSILHKDYDYEFLFSSVKRVNNVTFVVSNFIRSFVLYQFNKNFVIPKLNKNFIMSVFKLFATESRGPKRKNRNNSCENDLQNFYSSYFYKKTNVKPFDQKNLSYIVGEIANQMVISYENNIKMNYFKYVCQFVNQHFKQNHMLEIQKFDGNKKELKRNLKFELRKLKDALIEQTDEYEPKYKTFYDKYKDIILPKRSKLSFVNDIKVNHYEYLKCMLFMNNNLEKNGFKMFQPISLRTDIKDKYITINTNALVDISPLKNKNSYFKNISNEKDDIWSTIFNVKRKSFKIKGYTFNHQIQTDGYGVSLNFINNDEIENKIKQNNARTKGRNDSKRIYKNKTDSEIEKLKNKKGTILKKKKIKNIEKIKKLQKKKKEEYKKLSLDNKNKIKLKMRLNKEFNYISDLVKLDTTLKQLKKAHKDNKLVYVDPGKRSIGMFMGDNNKKFDYTSRRRLTETKRLKYRRLIDNRKYKTFLGGKNVKYIENLLTIYNKKTLNSDKFIGYVKIKIKMRNFVMDELNYNMYMKKLKYFEYINKKNHENKILQELEDKYGKDATIIVGDWSDKCRLSYISTPCLGFKRMLRKKFKVHLLDEYKTSKLNYKTLQETKKLNLYFNNEYRELHSVLTYQMGNNRMGCINRDLNAVHNFKQIVESLLKTKERPEAFKRSKKIKSTNRSKKVKIKDNNLDTSNSRKPEVKIIKKKGANRSKIIIKVV